jgi:hypothetical protein
VIWRYALEYGYFADRRLTRTTQIAPDGSRLPATTD